MLATFRNTARLLSSLLLLNALSCILVSLLCTYIIILIEQMCFCECRQKLKVQSIIKFQFSKNKLFEEITTIVYVLFCSGLQIEDRLLKI